jgi:hypothetical protein
MSYATAASEFQSLTEAIDTQTLGHPADDRRIFRAGTEPHRETTGAGVGTARDRSVESGRKRKLTLAYVAHARKRIAASESPEAVAEFYHVGRETLYRAMNWHMT